VVDVNDNGGNDAGSAPSPRALQGARESPNGVLNAEACPYLDGRPADARGSRAQAKRGVGCVPIAAQAAEAAVGGFDAI
jgi:hypothetical protein